MTMMNESPARALLRHRRALAKRLASRLGTAQAEDLASEAMTRGLARPAPDGRQGPWIETIFRNLVRDERRRDGRRGRPVPLHEDLAAASATPEDAVLAAECTRVVSAAMPAIPGELREAVVARFFEDQAYEGLAERCGISPATARTRVHRGLARLRAVLGRAWAWIPIWPRGLVGAGTHATAAALVPAVAVAIFATAPSGRARVGAVVAEHEGTALIAQSRSARRRAAAPSVGPAKASEDGAAGADSGAPDVAEGTRSKGTRQASSTVVPRPPGGGTPGNGHSSVRGDRAGQAGAADQDDAPAAVRRLAFEDDEVTGDLKSPGSVLVTGEPHRQTFDSLIEIPASFEPAMTKMIEDM